MLTHITAVLIQTGLPRETAAPLAAVVVTPPPGSIAVAELPEASAVQLALLAAIVAATDVQQFGAALQHLVAVLRVEQTALTDYEAGRFWHLNGVVAWRLEQALAAATRALNRSLTFLVESPRPRRRGIWRASTTPLDSSYSIKACSAEARREFELALRHRDPTDEEGTALTLGNLGRLCLELGDFASAATYFAQDLAIVTRRTPERTHLRTQLWSHLGTCALEEGRLADAQDAFTQSATLAMTDGQCLWPGLRGAGAGEDRLAAWEISPPPSGRPSGVDAVPRGGCAPGDAGGVRGLLCQLLADIHLAAQHPAQAVAAYQEALPALGAGDHGLPGGKGAVAPGAGAGAPPAGGRAGRRGAPARRAACTWSPRPPTSCARRLRRSCRQASPSRGCYTLPDGSSVPGSRPSSSCAKPAVGASAGTSRMWSFSFLTSAASPQSPNS